MFVINNTNSLFSLYPQDSMNVMAGTHHAMPHLNPCHNNWIGIGYQYTSKVIIGLSEYR